ncbi:glucose oxidase [Venturia nashicola]|uniref:Glucose oxidase n=1 Tax=Venturia nashicola TaxID=86259 RepID=A0A4Z1NTL9_9PEZI|nr:glucose oxidase [Venturia nashicola]TLD29780.1 glucose oxidase [Venturia nashicola]
MMRQFVTLALASSAFALPNSLPKSNSSYDYIVVGGGVSGLVVANRLSEDPAISVAVIEPGDSVFNNINVTDPAGYSKAFGTPIDWAYVSEPQAYARNETQILRAGKALGGTSTINGMTYMRAETSQIDAWKKVGNSVDWDSLLHYYKKSEGFQEPTEDQISKGASFLPDFHGTEGPLAVSWPTDMIGNNFSSVLNASFNAIGLPWNGEANGGYMRGFNVFTKTHDRDLNVREDAARAYYYPISSRPNLHVYLNSTAQHITWSTNATSSAAVADGVVFVDQSGAETSLQATKEVILSAGSLVSPRLLELSGVGNPHVLEPLGIEVKVNSPFVGENLQDQTTSGNDYTANQNFTNSGLGGFIGYFNAFDVWGKNTTAFAAKIKSSLEQYAKDTVQVIGGTVDAETLIKLFTIQHDLIFKDNVTISEVIVNAPADGTGAVSYWGLMPFSRGNIHIKSKNASVPASINPNYFMLDYDIAQQVGTARMARKVATTAPLNTIFTSETTPGLSTVPADDSESAWGEWLKKTYRSNYHYISTAAMMSQELGGVVDDEHKVYGTANVRVIDASVVPFQVSGHLTSTLYALAERAVDLVKASHA